MGFWGSFFGKIRKALLPACRAVKSFCGYVFNAVKRTATYCIDRIVASGKWVINWTRQHPYSAALIIAGTVILVIPLVVGFTPAGIAAGSAAAAWHALIGNAVAGSLFSILQSLAMGGIFVGVGVASIVVGVVSSWFS